MCYPAPICLHGCPNCVARSWAAGAPLPPVTRDVLVELANGRTPTGVSQPARFDPLAQPVTAVRIGHAPYPPHLASTLGDHAPHTLWLKGNTELLGAVALSVSGSRTPSRTGLAIARQCGRDDVRAGRGDRERLRRRDRHRGASRGTCRQAARRSLCLAEGINQLQLKPEIGAHY